MSQGNKLPRYFTCRPCCVSRCTTRWQLNFDVSAVLMRQKKAKPFNIQSTTRFVGGARIIV